MLEVQPSVQNKLMLVEMQNNALHLVNSKNAKHNLLCGSFPRTMNSSLLTKQKLIFHKMCQLFYKSAFIRISYPPRVSPEHCIMELLSAGGFNGLWPAFPTFRFL